MTVDLNFTDYQLQLKVVKSICEDFDLSLDFYQQKTIAQAIAAMNDEERHNSINAEEWLISTIAACDKMPNNLLFILQVAQNNFRNGFNLSEDQSPDPSHS